MASTSNRYDPAIASTFAVAERPFAVPRPAPELVIPDDQSREPMNGPIVALIPAYNEERFIGSLVIAIRPYVDRVVVIDDGSADRTFQIAQQAGATVIRHQVNQGKAAAVNTGFEYARQMGAGAAIMLDGDGQHRAEDTPTVLAPVLSGVADIVVGSRFLGVKNKIPAYRQFGQHSLTLATNLASGVHISDSQSGYRAFSARAINTLSFSKGGFSIESEMQFLAHEFDLRVVEAPVHVIYAERAKRNPVKHGMQVLDGIVSLMSQTRPLLYFGFSGALVFLLGIALGLYVVDIFTHTQTLAVGYGLVTVLLCVIGMLLFFAGVILHSTRNMLTEMRRCVVERAMRRE